MKVGALIPARIGSKRLPKKNIKILGGKPLICWTIDVLLEADFFSDITVSTESSEIEDIIRTYYPEKKVNILKRPQILAGDNSSLSDVLFQYLETNQDIEWYGLFLPTFPFRKKEKLIEAYTQILSRYPWRVESISQDEYSTLDYYYPVADGVKRFFRAQPFYCTLNRPAYILANRNCPEKMWGRFGLSINERTYKLHISRKEYLDIDTEEQFHLAEKIADGYQIQQKPILEYETDHWYIVAPKGLNISKFINYIPEKTLTDLSQPTIILENASPSLTFLRLFDGNTRGAWTGSEAYSYLVSQEVQKTGNMSLIPKHFYHTPHYRLLRKYKSETITNFLVDSDMRGVIYGSGTGTGTESIIKSQNIIMYDDLKQQDFYIPPFSIVKNTSPK